MKCTHETDFPRAEPTASRLRATLNSRLTDDGGTRGPTASLSMYMTGPGSNKDPLLARAMTETAPFLPCAVSDVPSKGSTAMSHSMASLHKLIRELIFWSQSRYFSPAAIPNPLAAVEHGRLVLCALSNHHDAVHVHRIQNFPHHVDRRLIRSVLVTFAQPSARNGNPQSKVDCSTEWTPHLPLANAAASVTLTSSRARFLWTVE